MSDLAQTAGVLRPTGDRWRGLRARLRYWRDGLVGTPLTAALTIGCLALLAWVLPPLLRWLVLDAVWLGDQAQCRAASGACWAFIGEKLRFILFGFYPPAEQGRSALVLVLLLALVVVSAIPRLWHRRLLLLWLGGLSLALALMAGGLGLPVVASGNWGGLTLTLLLALVGFGGAFPLGVLLALARRSRLVLVRLMAVAVIEVVRAVPLIALLYVAALLLPLMLPAGVSLDKLLRAQLAIMIFAAAYQAEIVRAGLNAVERGQYEAAAALGLSWSQMMRLVILPQALKVVIPAFVTLAIGLLQETTLVIVIGAFDVLAAAKAAATDLAWYGYYNEAFLFVAVIYFVLCFGASRYSLWLERRLRRG